MANPLSGASIICLESEAFFAICEYVATDVRNKIQVKDKWIGEKEAMRRLGIKSKATLQKLRDRGDIIFTQPMKKVILYDADSIDLYLERHSTK